MKVVKTVTIWYKESERDSVMKEVNKYLLQEYNIMSNKHIHDDEYVIELYFDNTDVVH